MDQTAAAESLVAQMGSFKAGVQVVTFAEKDSIDALDHALKSTNAKGLFFTPDNRVDQAQTRASLVDKLMPELRTMYSGDELSVKAYPSLRHIVQTGFTNIRGVNMFKDVAVYANPKFSSK